MTKIPIFEYRFTDKELKEVNEIIKLAGVMYFQELTVDTASIILIISNGERVYTQSMFDKLHKLHHELFIIIFKRTSNLCIELTNMDMFINKDAVERSKVLSENYKNQIGLLDRFREIINV